MQFHVILTVLNQPLNLKGLEEAAYLTRSPPNLPLELELLKLGNQYLSTSCVHLRLGKIRFFDYKKLQ